MNYLNKKTVEDIDVTGKRSSSAATLTSRLMPRATSPTPSASTKP